MTDVAVSQAYDRRPREMSETPGDVAARLARFARTRNPSELWPGLTEPARVAAARELERVTRALLAGRTCETIDPRGVHDAYAIAIAGHTTGMAPLLGHAIETGRLAASDDVAMRLTNYLAHARRHSARMEREVAPALDALRAAGITPTILKGFHTARVYYDEPALRRMADVDVKVPADRVDDAEAALRAGGFRPASSAHRPYKREWIGTHVDTRFYSLEVPDARSRWLLELHASLDRVFHPGAVAKLDRERDCTDAITLSGHDVTVLRQPLLLLTLACHCSQELDGSRLLRLLEMVRVIRADTAAGRLDWDDFLSMMRRTKTARFAFPALALVEALAPGTVDPRALSLGRRSSTWAARHTVARLVPAGGSLDDRGVVRQLMWTRGPVAVAQRVLRVVWPASFTSTHGVVAAWRARLRRIRAGSLTFAAPDEHVIPREPVIPRDIGQQRARQ